MTDEIETSLQAIGTRIAMEHSGLPGTFAKGDVRLHSQDGLINLVAGQYLAGGRVSNHWYWIVLKTGEMKNGYGGEWPLAKDFNAVTDPGLETKNEPEVLFEQDHACSPSSGVPMPPTGQSGGPITC